MIHNDSTGNRVVVKARWRQAYGVTNYRIARIIKIGYVEDRNIIS
jgi:hypothetical protein